MFIALPVFFNHTLICNNCSETGDEKEREREWSSRDRRGKEEARGSSTVFCCQRQSNFHFTLWGPQYTLHLQQSDSQKCFFFLSWKLKHLLSPFLPNEYSHSYKRVTESNYLEAVRRQCWSLGTPWAPSALSENTREFNLWWLGPGEIHVC